MNAYRFNSSILGAARGPLGLIKGVSDNQGSLSSILSFEYVQNVKWQKCWAGLWRESPIENVVENRIFIKKREVKGQRRITYFISNRLLRDLAPGQDLRSYGLRLFLALRVFTIDV